MMMTMKDKGSDDECDGDGYEDINDDDNVQVDLARLLAESLTMMIIMITMMLMPDGQWSLSMMTN